MDEALNKQKAKEVFEQLCRVLTEEDIKFERFDDDLVVTYGIIGDDLPMQFVVIVDADAQVISFLSPMEFTVAEDKRLELAVAICEVNKHFINGSFEYDVQKGDIRFKIVTTFRDSTLGDEAFKYMYHLSAITVDKFNDKFLALSKGMIDIEKFVELLNAE